MMDMTGNRKILLADRAEHLITSHRAVYSYHRFQTIIGRRSLAFLCLWPFVSFQLKHY